MGVLLYHLLLVFIFKSSVCPTLVPPVTSRRGDAIRVIDVRIFKPPYKFVAHCIRDNTWKKSLSNSLVWLALIRFYFSVCIQCSV